MDSITQLIGKVVVYGGGTVAIAYVLFVFWGKHLVNHWFKKELENFKHEKNTELEKLKLKMNTMFNRVLKTQDREYDILPTLWNKLQKLRIEVSRAVMMFRESPDLNKCDEKSLERLIKEEEIPEAIADRLRNEKDKNDIYSKYLDHKQMHQAYKAFLEFDEYYQSNKIFISPELKDKFSQIHTHLWSVWVDRKMSLNDRGSQTDFWGKAHEGIQKKVEPLLNEIEILVQRHLYNHTYE